MQVCDAPTKIPCLVSPCVLTEMRQVRTGGELLFGKRYTRRPDVLMSLYLSIALVLVRFKSHRSDAALAHHRIVSSPVGGSALSAERCWSNTIATQFSPLALTRFLAQAAADEINHLQQRLQQRCTTCQAESNGGHGLRNARHQQICLGVVRENMVTMTSHEVQKCCPLELAT